MASTPENTKILIRDIPAELVARIQVVADLERRSRNSQVITLLEEALDQRDRLFDDVYREVIATQRALRAEKQGKSSAA